MINSPFNVRRVLGVTLVALLAGARPGAAQVTPAAGYTPPDDTPAIKVGVTMFLDYTVNQRPKSSSTWTPRNSTASHPRRRRSARLPCTHW